MSKLTNVFYLTLVTWDLFVIWRLVFKIFAKSGRRDSNPQPHAPKARALASCATPRMRRSITSGFSEYNIDFFVIGDADRYVC